MLLELRHAISQSSDLLFLLDLMKCELLNFCEKLRLHFANTHTLFGDFLRKRCFVDFIMVHIAENNERDERSAINLTSLPTILCFVDEGFSFGNTVSSGNPREYKLPIFPPEPTN